MVMSRWESWKQDVILHKQKMSLSVILITISLFLNFLSGFYVEKVATATPKDLILDHLPAYDLSYLLVGLFLLVLLIFWVYPFVYTPRKIHYTIGIFSLFILIRSGFVVLTHLKVPPGAIPITAPFFYDLFSFSNYLFFSGHVGLPFLGFLIFDKKPLRYFMLASSIILGITVLVMHIHYSIDVFAAYFITYGVYKIGDYVFND